jgi:hypothetical protein
LLEAFRSASTKSEDDLDVGRNFDSFTVIPYAEIPGNFEVVIFANLISAGLFSLANRVYPFSKA